MDRWLEIWNRWLEGPTESENVFHSIFDLRLLVISAWIWYLKKVAFWLKATPHLCYKRDSYTWVFKSTDSKQKFTLPSQHLLPQNQQWKHQNNVWNLLKVNNKEPEWHHLCHSDVSIVTFEYFTHCSGVSIVDIEQKLFLKNIFLEILCYCCWSLRKIFFKNVAYNCLPNFLRRVK